MWCWIILNIWRCSGFKSTFLPLNLFDCAHDNANRFEKLSELGHFTLVESRFFFQSMARTWERDLGSRMNCLFLYRFRGWRLEVGCYSLLTWTIRGGWTVWVYAIFTSVKDSFFFLVLSLLLVEAGSVNHPSRNPISIRSPTKTRRLRDSAVAPTRPCLYSYGRDLMNNFTCSWSVSCGVT